MQNLEILIRFLGISLKYWDLSLDLWKVLPVEIESLIMGLYINVDYSYFSLNVSNLLLDEIS